MVTILRKADRASPVWLREREAIPQQVEKRRTTTKNLVERR
jgi:hypothetical protein